MEFGKKELRVTRRGKEENPAEMSRLLGQQSGISVNDSSAQSVFDSYCRGGISIICCT